MAYQSWASSAGSRATMLANKRRDTKPELLLRAELHRRGMRFRKDLRLDLGSIRPRPDVVFTRARVAVFVDGCFWHSCPQHGTRPKENGAFWASKLAGNAERDRRQDDALREAGWGVVRVWEHTPTMEAADEVERLVKAGLASK